MKCDKEYIFLQNNERAWSCKASSENEAWLFFKQIKKLNTTDLKKLFKIKTKDMITEQQSTVESTTIKSALYNFITGSLKITFSSGTMYEYSNVPSEIYDDFCKAESQGKFLNEKIKGTYNYSKIENNDK